MMQHIRKIWALLLALCLLAGCGGTPAAEDELPLDAEPNAGGTSLTVRKAVDDVFSVNYDPEGTMNPIWAESAANMQFSSLIYDSVFTVNEDFSVSSEIVTDYNTEDHSWWVFNMRTDLSFSDGTPLTATDVAYSIRVAQSSSYYRTRLRCVYGVSALGDGSFAISTSQPNSFLPALLNIPIIRSGDYYEEFPVGSGLYMLNEDHTALVLNPRSRHAGEAPVDTVYLKDYMDASERITAFEEASVDIVTNDPTGMYNLGYGSSNETRYYDTTNLHFIGFNTRSNYFQSAGTRGAVAYVVDRDYVVEELMNGCGAVTALPIHPRSELYDTEYAESFVYDPETAATLFTAAGVGDLDDDGELEILVTGIIVEFRIKFIVNSDSSVKVAAARKITEELNALGIKTTLYELSWDDFIHTLEDGDYDMYYGEVRLGMDWDISYLFKVPAITPGRETDWGMNYARTTDESYTRLYDAYLAAGDEERESALRDAVRGVCDSAIIIPVCFERRQILTHRGVVSNLHATQYDLFHRFPEWSVTFE